MQVRYIGMFDSVEVPGLSPDPGNIVVTVARGEVVAVPAGPERDAVAGGLLIQARNWEPADAEAKAVAARVIAEFEAKMRDRAGLPPIAPAASEPANDAAVSGRVIKMAGVR